MKNQKSIDEAVKSMKAKELILQDEISLGLVSPADAESILLQMKERQLNTVTGIDTSDERVKTDGQRWWTNLGRKKARAFNCKSQIFAMSRNRLIEKIYAAVFTPVDPTLSEAFEQWLVYKYENQDRSSKTIKEYRSQWNSLLKDSSIAKKNLSSITVDDISDYFFSITKGHTLSKKRYINIKSVLNGVFNYYRKYLHFNPVEDFDDSLLKGHFSSGGEDLNNYYCDDDVRLLVHHLKDSDKSYDMAICFSCYVALRIGEIIAIKYSDYNPETHTLKIVRSAYTEYELSRDDSGHMVIGEKTLHTEPRLKGNLESSKRCIPIPKDAETIIEKAHSLSPDSEYLFSINNRQLSHDIFNRHLKSACNEIGITYRSSHKLRFYNARRLYNLVGLEKTSFILGHASTEQTLHYIKQSKLSTDDYDNIYENMNSFGTDAQ